MAELQDMARGLLSPSSRPPGNSSPRVEVRVMWEVKREEIRNGRAARYILPRTGVAQVIEGWRSDPDFRSFFSGLLADSPFPAFVWEVKPFGGRVLDQDFEFVLAPSKRLALAKATPRSFSKHFEQQDSSLSVLDFPNFSNDATFVVPREQEEPTQLYTHLASFLRGGPDSQVQALWERLGEVLASQIAVRPLWVSTSKVGVRWLHLRVDSVPKHFRHKAYRKFAEDER